MQVDFPQADPIVPTPRGVLVGRSRTADILLHHPWISRRHALVLLADGGVVVRDLGSRRGVKVNGLRVQEQALREGDWVEIGPIAFRLDQGCLRPACPREGIHLEVRNLSKTLGRKRILSGVSLSLAPGQFVGILGGSGSGKTTLLKCLAGHWEPDTGQRLFNGFDLAVPDNQESYRSMVGYVPQDDVLHWSLTGREILEFTLRLRSDQDAGERHRAIDQTLERLQMSDHADQLIRHLSGGQRKRISVGLDLLFQPRLLLLDEPTSGLDPAQESRLMRFLRLVASQGTTVVCTTHVLENLRLFDQMVVLSQGTVAFQGPPAELFSRFGVANYCQLYETLEGQVPDAEPALAGGLVEGNAGPLVKLRAPKPPVRLPMQAVVQAQRGLRLIRRDRVFLFFLVFQPLLIGLLINLSQLRPDGVEGILTFGVVASIWLGLNNTAREVVRERRIYSRERLVGAVTMEGYLAAKTLLFAALGLSQVVLLVLVIRRFNLLGPGDARSLETAASWAYLILVLWLSYCAGMLLGLTISTVASTEEVAVAVLPLIILPQLLLTNLSTGLRASDGYLGSLILLFQGSASRDGGEWVLECASLLTYSRPAVALLAKTPSTAAHRDWIGPMNWLHLALLLAVTSAALLVAFWRTERRWRE